MEGEETQHGISDVKWPIVRTWESPCCPLVWGNGKFEIVALKFPCSWHHCVTSKVKPCCFYFLPPSDDFRKVRVQKLKKKKNPQKPKCCAGEGAYQEVSLLVALPKGLGFISCIHIAWLSSRGSDHMTHMACTYLDIDTYTHAKKR